MMTRPFAYIAFWLCCCTQLSLHASGLLRDLPDLPFVHFDHNELVVEGGCEQLEHFFCKLDTVMFMGKGHLHVLHIGGSHVQAGTMTQQFRDNLLELSADLAGGPYFVFPFAAGKTNTPSHYRISYTGEWKLSRSAVVKPDNKRMGLAGVAVTTRSNDASVRVVTRPRTPSDRSPQFCFDQVTVLGYDDETGRSVPVVAWGDSVLHGDFDTAASAYRFTLPALTDSVCICFERMPGEFTLTGVLLGNGRDGISVNGIGANGAKVTSYLACEDFARDLALIPPDLVIFGIGINDAIDTHFQPDSFKMNYHRLIDRIRSVSPDCALLFITNNDSYRKIRSNRYQVNSNGSLAEKAFLELGREWHAPVWDQFDVMGGIGSMQQWQNKGLAQKDKVHFTAEGYRLMGDLLFNALAAKYAEHQKRQLDTRQP